MVLARPSGRLSCDNAPMTTQSRKQAIYTVLEKPHDATGAGKFAAGLLAVLIALNALLIFVVFDDRLQSRFHSGLYLFDAVCSLVFFVEYLGRLWVADMSHPHLSPARARLRYALSPFGIIDLLSFLPFVAVLAGLIPYQTLNTLRVLRIMRLIKISRYMRGLTAAGAVIRKRQRELIASFAVLGLLTVTASVLMYQVEHPVQPDNFDSIFTGMYWALTTITTTGYGDLVPHTAAGRLIGFATMALSIGLVAIPAGIFTAGYIDEMHDAESDDFPARGPSANNDMPPTHCPHCGKPLRNNENPSAAMMDSNE